MNEPRRRRTSVDGGNDDEHEHEHHDLHHAEHHPTIDHNHNDSRSLPPPPSRAHLSLEVPHPQEHQHAPPSSVPSPPNFSGLSAFSDTHKIIQLLQCSICSRPLRSPMTFPCGNSLCRSCVPPMFQRRNISYPDIPGRREGLKCPFLECGKEHAIADCCMDFTLMKVMDAIEKQIADTPASGSRILRAYSAAKAGLLPYNYEETGTFNNTDVDDGSDEEVFASIQLAASLDMDCQVCYQLLIDPVTPYCGHTFCRPCLQQVLDHSPLCPTCRQPLQLPTNLPSTFGGNKRISRLLSGLYPDALAQRAAILAADNESPNPNNDLKTPIFVCTCSFPTMPTPLFIFEPRYRLMIRRAWESDRKFGMVLPNRTGEQQGDLGVAPFMEYGTMLHIDALHVYPDGRSHIWTTGVSKFKIRRWGWRDEYIVADTERVDDLPIADEEALEAAEISPPSSLSPNAAPSAPSWTRLPTAALLRAALAFVERMRASSAPRLTEENLVAFGQPPRDAATFPYWLASILPVADEERYRLIAARSVRQRLVVVVGWVKRLEEQRWFVAVPFNSVFSGSTASSSSSDVGTIGAVGTASDASSTPSSGDFACSDGTGSAVIC